MENGQHKKYIFICTGSDCKKNGSKLLKKALSGQMKSTGPKAPVDIIATKCIGHCKKGPNVIVDNCLYHKVKEKDLEGILSRSKFPVV